MQGTSNWNDHFELTLSDRNMQLNKNLAKKDETYLRTSGPIEGKKIIGCSAKKIWLAYVRSDFNCQLLCETPCNFYPLLSV